MHRAEGGLAADLGLYGLSAAFAAVTAANSTLLPHRGWGAVAAIGYLAAAVVVLGQLLLRRRAIPSPFTGTTARASLAVLTWAAVAVAPMILQSVQRAAGHAHRAQEEVQVIEEAGQRLLTHGTPYLTREAIATLAPTEQLFGYLPYQPGMALFGLPRAAAGNTWWTDSRIWLALVTAAVLALTIRSLRRPNHPRTDPFAHDAAIVRALQLTAVIPISALTLATGGQDLPVLALCLLALALQATRRHGTAGLAVGLAAALKLFAGPVAFTLLIHSATRGWRTAARFCGAALALPIAALAPAHLINPAALVENVLRFPLGKGLVTSPAQSPLPGYLIASALPAGEMIAAALLVAAGLTIAVHLTRHPPRTVAATAIICGYGLLAAILLMPTTRFGYLLYPIAFFAWAPVLRHTETPTTHRIDLVPKPAQTPLTTATAAARA
ncbi:MAG TPA: glycosyltransferase 87 family protein [Micromonosporaceae bacterium]|nr:glycosyltransferase 87 family protein [Micromonosporaceae bacterium]